MSSKRDILKALKANGFRLVPTDGRKVRHHVWTNGEREVRVHLGDTMSTGRVRGVLGQIRHGNVKTKKEGK